MDLPSARGPRAAAEVGPYERGARLSRARTGLPTGWPGTSGPAPLYGRLDAAKTLAEVAQLPELATAAG